MASCAGGGKSRRTLKSSSVLGGNNRATSSVYLCLSSNQSAIVRADPSHTSDGKEDSSTGASRSLTTHPGFPLLYLLLILTTANG